MNAHIQTFAQRSLKNRVWQLPTFSEGDVHALVAQGANALTAPILAARGMSPDDVENFLKPSIRSLLPSPSFFNDMDAAADRITKAIVEKEKIAIWSDYDVDGATSAATMGRFLRECGVEFEIYIPDRINEGYGPNTNGLMSLQAVGNTLIIVLDSGTTAFQPLQDAHDAGLDVVVIDHHAAEATVPVAVAVVNPNRLDQEPGYNHLCAAGMTFIACVAINMRLRQLAFYDGKDGRSEKSPDLMRYLDLVALGTICDVVPLTTLNRAFVIRGLPILSERALPGISALAHVAACKDEIGTQECGFALGPRINAGGRIGTSSAGALLLLEEDPEKALQMATELDALNQERRAMEKECTDAALRQFQDDFIPGETRKIAIAVVDAHEGIVGISAARLKEALDAPAFVLAPTHKDTLKGSGRSVPGFDLGHAVIAARKKGILIAGGGHGMAAGMEIDPSKLDEFIAFMNAEIDKSEYATTGVVSKADNSIPIGRATLGMVDASQSLAPFGMGNPTPKFVIAGLLIGDVRVTRDRETGDERHVYITFQDPSRGPAGPLLDAPLWNAANTDFANKVIELKGQIVDCLGSIEKNTYGGRSKPRIKVEDIRLSI